MAKSVFRKFTKTVLISINAVISLFFLLACLTPYVNPTNWWIIGFLGLIVPYLVLALIFFIIIWLMAKPFLALIPLITLIIGWQQIFAMFALHPGNGFGKRRHDNIIRIVDWNVQSFNGLSMHKDNRMIIQEELAESILKLHPDVICLQEFNTAKSMDNIAIFSRQYRYHYFSKDYQRAGGSYQSGCIIFSKFPIIDSGKIKYPVDESLIYADIKKDDDTIRVFTTHLQSFKFQKEDYTDIEKIRDQADEDLTASKSIFRKMKLAFRRRGVQANMVREAIDKSPFPSVICGDFNDVPNSYAYFQIRGDFQDAFLQKGFAIGRTFVTIAPTLRIDYILPSKQFRVNQFDMIDEGLSDHIMLVSDIVLKK